MYTENCKSETALKLSQKKEKQIIFEGSANFWSETFI